MFLNIFNCIVFDEEMNLASCLRNEYILAAITAREMSVLVPMIHDFMNCETLADILIVGDLTTESLMDEFHIDEKTIEKWLTEGISDFEKYALTFLFSSAQLETMRHHTCQVCFADYFSNDAESDVCQQCAADIYRNFWC